MMITGRRRPSSRRRDDGTPEARPAAGCRRGRPRLPGRGSRDGRWSRQPGNAGAGAAAAGAARRRPAERDPRRQAARRAGRGDGRPAGDVLRAHYGLRGAADECRPGAHRRHRYRRDPIQAELGGRAHGRRAASGQRCGPGANRAWVPGFGGGGVLAVWAILGLVMVRAFTGIPAAARVPAVPSIPSYEFLRPAGMRPAPLGRGLLLVALAMLVAIPAAWMVLGQSSQDDDTPAGSGDHTGHDGAGAQQSPLSATLVRSIGLVSTDASGGLTSGSADLPSDVALIDGRLILLHSNRGRVLAGGGGGKP